MRVTDPAVMSAALAVYTGCKAPGVLKVPVPEVLHVSDAAPAAEDKVNASVPVSHILSSGPALAWGSGFMVMVTWEVTGPHGVFPLACMVNTTECAAVSAAPGVYTGFWIKILLNVPVPAVVQSILL